MFRNIKFNSKDNEFKAILYRNRREEEGEIPSEYIDEINYKLKECDTMNLTIPNKVFKDGRAIDNPIYNKIKGKRTIVINNKERFIISELKVESNKNLNKKKVVAKSFEYDLNKKDITVPQGTFQLYKGKNDKVNVEEGVLNWLERETTWRIGYVDPMAKSDIGLYDEEKEFELYETLNKKNIQIKDVLFDKDVDINIGKKALNFSIKYNDIVSMDSTTNTTKKENYSHDFDNFVQPIKHIKATYTLDSSYNTVIKYEFTLQDGFIKKETKPFTYLQNLDVKFNGITLVYKTGNEVEKEKVKYRSFDRNTHQWLSFLREVVEIAFDCIFQFDTLNKIVTVYAKDNLGQDNGFYLYYNQYMMKFDKDLKVDEVITRLVVEGKDGLSINDVNPLGTNYVEDFTYLIQQGNLSEELQSALIRYSKLLEKNLKIWTILKEEKNKKSKASIYLDAQLQEIKEKLDVNNSIKIAYIRAGEDKTELQHENYEQVNTDIEQLNKDFNSLMKELSDLKEDIKKIDLLMQESNNSIKKENATDELGKIFTKEDLEELDECIYSERQQDDYYTDSKELYTMAKRLLEEKNQIPISFTTDVVGITKHPRGWRNLIRLGDIGHIDIDDVENKNMLNVRITGFKYIPPKKSLDAKVTNIEFNNDKVLHDIKTIRNVSVRQIKYAKSAISFWRNTWIDSSANNKIIGDIRNKGINASVISIKSQSKSNATDITSTGMWCTDKTDGTNNKQIYMGSGFISVTNDNWNTSKLIADEKGVVARSIFGTGIIGERMKLANSDNTFKIDENGMSIYNEEKNLKARFGFYEKDGKNISSFIAYDNNGKLLISGDGITQVDSISFNDNVDKNIDTKMFVNIPNSVKDLRESYLFIHLDRYKSSIIGVDENGDGEVVTSIDESGSKHFDMHGNNYKSNKIKSVIANINSKFRKNITNDIYSDNSHNHTVQFEKHGHEPLYGIVETTMPKNLKIWVNDVLVAEDINEDIKIDISSYLKINELNVIRFQSERLGRINGVLTLNEFISI